MKIGCGYRVMHVRGRDYLYFWQYEPRDGRRRQVYDYVGPERDGEARRKVVELLEQYTRRAIEEARRRLQSERLEGMAAARGRIPGILWEGEHGGRTTRARTAVVIARVKC